VVEHFSWQRHVMLLEQVMLECTTSGPG
jgi:hypothetical protein